MRASLRAKGRRIISVLQAPLSDAVFAHHPAALGHAPASGFQRGVDVFGADFGFVHHSALFIALKVIAVTGKQLHQFGMNKQFFLGCLNFSQYADLN